MSAERGVQHHRAPRVASRRRTGSEMLGTVSKDRQKGKNRIKRRRGGGKKWEGINDYTQ
jgi:hypothetical protein